MKWHARSERVIGRECSFMSEALFICRERHWSLILPKCETGASHRETDRLCIDEPALKEKPASQLRDLELLQRRGSKQRLEFGHLLLRGFFHPRFGSGGKGFLQSLLTQGFVL